MARISDPVLAAIESGASNGGLPRGTARVLFYFIRLLLSAKTLNDVSIFAEIQTAPSGRHWIAVTAKWRISFVIEIGTGPADLRLEKLEKSWRANPARSLSRPRRARS